MGTLATAQAHRQRDDAHRQRDERSFLLQRAQPAMTGLIDGSLSTRRFFSTGFFRSFISVALGGAIIAAVSAALGAVG